MKHDHHHRNHDDFLQRFIITIDIPGPGIDTIAAATLLDVLNHFEHEGIWPYRTTLEIRGPTTH
jgi:hypothetical protein